MWCKCLLDGERTDGSPFNVTDVFAGRVIATELSRDELYRVTTPNEDKSAILQMFDDLCQDVVTRLINPRGRIYKACSFEPDPNDPASLLCLINIYAFNGGRYDDHYIILDLPEPYQMHINWGKGDNPTVFPMYSGEQQYMDLSYSRDVTELLTPGTLDWLLEHLSNFDLRVSSKKYCEVKTDCKNSQGLYPLHQSRFIGQHNQGVQDSIQVPKGGV